jgi:hypothetical protein
MAYAEDTRVSEEKSRAEIETLVRRFGASEFISGFSGDVAMIAFGINGRRVKMFLPLPDENEKRFHYDGRGIYRTQAGRQKACEQERRQRWRALLITLKAKFAAIEAGITTVEREFFADLLLPNNQTMAQFMAPQLDRIYERGELPPMLPGLPSAREGD